MNEKEIINEIKKDREYYDILEDLKQRNYSLKDVLRLFTDTETGNYTEYDIACCIVYLLDLYQKEKERNDELKEINKTLSDTVIEWINKICNKCVQSKIHEYMNEIKKKAGE